ncbi:hypothetical protein BC938DRAFT_471418 [Jimgerdemannia flammicorona]|uniref:Uncharacterized protein n=1 Tax=Jimgerdemannia flammicorona TaxID=994334 RepID=A0A433Q855_9FUNG|nr:hypothetical protein BC938DRAFT_471418 [Jimgerdemannia flammicorona]
MTLVALTPFARILSICPYGPLATLASKRPFSRSAPARDSATVIRDPAYPDLHYHSSPSPLSNSVTTTPYYALSFLDNPSVTSPLTRNLIIGWTPATTPPAISPATFIENGSFADLLHDVVKKNVGEGDEALKAVAEWQKEGWLHVADARNAPPYGRIPYPEDIIGSVLVQQGLIQPSSYQRNPTHRFVTPYGLFRLSVPLHAALVTRCREPAEGGKR